MGRMIPQSVIDQIESRIGIVDLAGELGGSVVRKGANAQASCFVRPADHKNGNRRKSLTFFENDNRCHCFGCGFSGGPIKMWMEVTGDDFPTTAKTLAERAGIQIEYEKEGPAVPDYQPKLFEALDVAQRYYVEALQSAPEVMAYLIDKRGFTEAQIKELGFGWAPADYGQGLKKALREAGIGLKACLLTDILRKKENSELYVTPMYARVMVPVEDARGRIVGFGGRVLDDSLPKYKNPATTELFRKDELIFNLRNASQAARKDGNRILVTEGYMDVNKLRAEGLENVVASMGTAFTPKQFEQLQKRCDEIVMCFDGDVAGRKAAERSLRVAVPTLDGSTKLKFLMLPEGEDPDSIVCEHGIDKFRELLDSSMSLSQYFGHMLTAKHGTDPEDKIKMVQEAGQILSTMEAGLYRDLMVESLAEATGIGEEKLRENIGLEESPAEKLSRIQASQPQPEEGVKPVSERRQPVSTNRPAELAHAMANTRQYTAVAAGRTFTPARGVTAKTITPEAGFFASYEDLNARLLSRPKITVEDFKAWRDAVGSMEAETWHGRVEPEHIQDRMLGFMKRYLIPKMKEAGASREMYAELHNEVASPDFASYLQDRLNTYVVRDMDRDPSADGGVMEKPDAKAELTQMIPRASGASPGR